MNFDDFDSYRTQAVLLHTNQQGEHIIGLDAIFTALVVHAVTDRRQPVKPRERADTAPAWFTAALARLAGQNVTAGSFLLLAGHSPVTDDDRRNVARWLKSAGKIPNRKGGQVLYQL